MPEQQTDQIQFLLSDFSTRLRDLEERNRLTRERVLLLGKNLISSKENLENEIIELKKQTTQNKRDLDKLKSISQNLIIESDKFVKKEEMAVIERLLKDFQPLEFMRKKDVEELIEGKIKIKKQLKTKKTSK